MSEEMEDLDITRYGFKVDSKPVNFNIKPIMEKEYTPSERLLAQIEKAFTYVAPSGTAPERYVAIRDMAKDFAMLIAEQTPESREQSIALTHLEEVVMFANAAIARNEVAPSKKD